MKKSENNKKDKIPIDKLILAAMRAGWWGILVAAVIMAILSSMK